MRIGSLFSGIGGLELGLEWAGVGHTVFQVEQDPYCLAVLAKHWPDAERFTDVREVGAHNLPAVDVLCGGFPCQDISSAGKKAGIAGDKSALWIEYLRIIGELRPRYVVVENVAVLLKRGLDRVLGALAYVGYDAEWDRLSSCAVGGSCMRRRLFLVARSDSASKSASPLYAEAPRLRAYAVHLRHGRQPQPGVVRMAPGVPRGLERVRALGNACDPRLARIVGGRLMQMEFEHLFI